MRNNKEYIKSLESVFEDVKFTANSYVRLKILATLLECPKNMKEITEVTKLSYSSVSSTMHDLELRGWIFREHNKYFLTNSTKIRVGNMLDLDKTVVLLDEFYNILQGHLIDMIPNESLLEFYLLEGADLIESSGVDAYKTYNFIQKCLNEAKSVKCVMPIFYEPFFNTLNDLISNNNDVEIYVPQNLLNSFKRKSGINSFKSFDELDSFLLIVTDKVMILGFFMDNGYFDQTRILTSKTGNSLLWANNLYENLKINEF